MYLFFHTAALAQKKQEGTYHCYSSQKMVKVYEKPDEQSAILSTYEPRVFFDVLKENHNLYYKVQLFDNQKKTNQFGFVKKRDVTLVFSYQIDDFEDSVPSKNSNPSRPTLGEKPKVNCTLCPTNSSKSN